MHPLKRIHLSLCYVIFLSDKEIEITAFDQKKYNRLAVLKILFISIFPQKSKNIYYTLNPHIHCLDEYANEQKMTLVLYGTGETFFDVFS